MRRWMGTRWSRSTVGNRSGQSSRPRTSRSASGSRASSAWFQMKVDASSSAPTHATKPAPKALKKALAASMHVACRASKTRRKSTTGGAKDAKTRWSVSL